MTPHDKKLVDEVLAEVSSVDLDAARRRVDLHRARVVTKQEELSRAELDLEDAERDLVEECLAHIDAVKEK